MTLKNAVSLYPEGRKKKLNHRFSQFSNFADTAVLLCTAVLTSVARLEKGNSKEE